jgi:hypothetical protein
MNSEDTKELERLRALLRASEGVGYKDRREAIQARIDDLTKSETVEETPISPPPLDLSQEG